MFAYPDDKVVKLAYQDKPALIVLDVDLPGAGGWNLLRELKAHPDTCNIPVMICSWLDEKERGTQAGASICLRMPILYGDFVDALHSIGVKVAAESE